MVNFAYMLISRVFMSFTGDFASQIDLRWAAGQFVGSLTNIQYKMWFCLISQLWLSSLTKCGFKDQI